MLETTNKDLKTGTTTVGVKTNDVVILAADQQTSLGHLSYETETRKIHNVTDKMALTTAGSVADAQILLRFMRSQAKLFEIERKTKISVKALSTYISNILNSHRFYPYEIQFILGGFIKEPELFELGPNGSVLARSNFAVTGSGTVLALSTLDRGYESNMPEEKAVELAVSAVNSAKKRDIYSGGRSITVLVIGKNGIKEVDDKVITEIVQKINKA